MANLLLNPEGLDGGSWSDLIGGVTTGNQAVAPDGTTTADLLSSDNAGGDGLCAVQQSVSIATSTQHALALFATPGTLNWLRFDMVNFGSLAINGYFDFANGVPGTQSANIDDSGVLGPYEIGGLVYYRAWYAFTTDGSDGTGNVRFWLSDGDGDISVARDGNSNVRVWGASLNEGAEPEPYVSEAGILIGGSPNKPGLGFNIGKMGKMGAR